MGRTRATRLRCCIFSSTQATPVYDIGAHIGMFAIPLAEAVGDDGKVIAVEADPDNFLLLQRNLRSRDLIGRAAALNGVAGGESGRYAARRGERHTSATYFVADPAGAPTVSFALDDLQRALRVKAGARRWSRSMWREWSFRFCARLGV